MLRFEGTVDTSDPSGGEAVFKVRWGVLDAHMEHTFAVSEKTYRSRAMDSKPEAMITALSETLTAFSYDLAQQLRGLPKSKPSSVFR